MWIEFHTVNKGFTNKAWEVHRTVTQRISSLETVLISLVGLYHSSDFLRTAEQTSFSQEMLKAYPYITSIMHMERIPHERLDQFEARMRDDGFIGFQLKNNTQYLKQNKFSNVDFHLPISFIEPMTPLSANLLGYDLVRVSGAFSAIVRAVKSGETSVSGRIRLGGTNNSNILIIKPVYLGRYPPIKESERWEMFSGIAALRIDRLQFIEQVIQPEIEIYLYHADNLAERERVNLTDKSSVFSIVQTVLVQNRLYFKESVDFYGAPFILSVSRRVGLKDIDWWKVTALWLISLVILGLTINVYRSRRIAVLKEEEADRAIAAEDARFSHVIETAFDAVITADSNKKIISWNQQACEVFGYTEREILGLHLFQLILTHKSLVQKSEIIDSLFDDTKDKPSGIRLEAVGKHKDNRQFSLDLSISSSRIGDLFTLSVFARDITERKRWDDKIRFLAYCDSLTNLPNRQSFKEQVDRAIKAARRHHWIGAVLYLDLDEFKRINDTLGHDIGDMLLKNVTNRLVSQLRDSDSIGHINEPEAVEGGCNVARLGGDEFTVLLEEIENPETAGLVAKRVQDAIVRSYNLNGHEVYVTPSIGIAIFPRDGCTVDELLKNADTAMYHAKAVGKNNFQFYSQQMNVLATSRLKLEGKLRKSLSHNEMQLFYQPQIDLASGKIVSAEALLRWDQPELGMISPGEFIPIAEETGMIIELGEWVLNEACKQNKSWQEAGYVPLRIAVNLSNMQFLRHDLSKTVAQALEKSGLDPKYLELEITESIIMRNVNETIITLNAFKEMGISISVDDFGTGYSSLGYLKRLPLDTLKIDRTFIKDIPDSEDDVTITSAIIAMAHSLGLGIVAEGVETESQLDFLVHLGCELAQGYLFSKPVPPDELMEMLQLQGVTELGPVNTHLIATVVPEKAPIKARGVKFGCSK
ncbi:MAG: EAL domain-containing protein [Candidatus Thiodiazotropha sp.]|nr:EAL domain-containing protein [Candidatus Thiodiazotropha sp.]MCM8921401.1 EAL domain-containing protein [Candidatus Thiodiazotropha sp.]